MTVIAKHRIIETLDDLPEQSLAAVAEFVEFLRAKALLGHAAPPPTPRPPATLGGLWKDHTFSEQEIDDARHEAWSSLGRDPS